MSVGVADDAAPATTDLRAASREFERRHIIKVLSKCKSKAAAAEALGIGLSSLYRKTEELSIDKNLVGDNED
jgi:transcriptional regulator with PAS, ATPase and Fis domain